MKSIHSLFLGCLLFVSSFAFSQGRSYYSPMNLETRISDLEWKLEQTNRRLESLERLLNQGRPPQFEERVDISCLIIDSGYNKTFLGSGRTKLDAEVAARQACTNGSYNVGQYCTGDIKCSSGFKNPTVRGYVCVVTDSGYGRTYKAEGKNEIEAEAKVRQTCTAGSYNVGEYCAKVKARCEAF